MLESDSDPLLDARSSSRKTKNRRARTRSDDAQSPRKSLEVRPLPRWARLHGATRGVHATAFFAGANLLALEQILHSGDDGVEPCYAGVLRQRLALKATASCARLARLREDEAALRDAEHLSGVGIETSPAGRVHRLWRLFATRPVKFDATTLSLAAQHFEALSELDALGLADALRELVTSADNPLAAAAHASATAMHYLASVPAIDAEILALWLADAALAQKLGWKAPIPLLATTITHPSLRTASNRRPRPSDPDWSLSVTRAYARAAQEAYALAGELSRRSGSLLRAAPKLRAKGAARVIEMLLEDDCVSASRAAKTARLSDRAARRLFERLMTLGAVRELSGRTNFRLYGL